MDPNEQITYNELSPDGGAAQETYLSDQEAASACQELADGADRSGMKEKIIGSLKALEPKRKRELTLWAAAAGVFLVGCIILLLLASPGNGRSFPVYISEVLASNTQYPNRDGRCCDYIELHNGADYPVDLTGFQLGDVAGNSRYQFPSGTTIGPGEYLVVYCDKTATGEFYASFGISRGGGEAFYLLGTNNAIIDSVVTIPTDLDQSMIRENGQWIATALVTPGRSNSGDVSESTDLYNDQVSTVRISELSSAKTGYDRKYGVHCDWVELYNTGSESADISGFRLSDNVGVDKYIFPEGTVLAPGEYYLVLCTDEVKADSLAPFGLSQLGGESVVLKSAGGMIVEIVDCVSMKEGESLMLRDGSWETTSKCSPGFPNSEEGHEGYLRFIGMDSRSIVISEVMSAGQTVLANSYGEFSDWVELCNMGQQSVDITGWYLSDNADDPDKWEFPQTVLKPGERLLVFCSGRDTVRDGELHTGFSLSSSGETLILSSFMGLEADAFTFGEAEENCSFICSGGSDEPVLTDCPTPGYSNDDAGYDQFCAARTPVGPLAIWEVMSSNDWYLPQALGQCYDWVELRNISGEPIRLSDYAITDDPDSPLMFTLPDRMLGAGETVVIILSGDESLSNGQYCHAGFSLNASKDQLLVYSVGGKLLDYVHLKQIPIGLSYGRGEQTGGFFYMEPTPGKANNTGTRQVSAMPTSEIAPGVYTGTAGFDVPFSAVGDVYYTTDGSDPDAGSSKYTGPIHVSETSVIRAVAVEDGKLPSQIYTLTFIINEPHSIPIVSLVTDPANLWGPNGIYKNNDITVKLERRSANIAYIGDDGSFSLNCELSLHGNSTVTKHDKKSFSIGFKNSYDGALNYDLFEDGEVTTFDTLAIRTAIEDTYSTEMRDVLFHEIAAANSDVLLSQKYKYVVLYLNGEYWGLYALREKHSESHYASYMNVPAASVTVIKNFIKPGTALHPTLQLCEQKSFRAANDYEYAKSILDVNSFADWIILQSYASNVDVSSNVRYYHSPADGLWRMGLVDVDYGCMYSTFAFESIINCFNHGIIVSALMENEEFQDLIATRLAELLSGPMSDENMIRTIQTLASTIRDEVPSERERWGGTAKEWESSVTHMINFCDGRAVEMVDSLCSCLHFTKEERAHYFGEVLAKYNAA